jgi:hypothetical protein
MIKNFDILFFLNSRVVKPAFFGPFSKKLEKPISEVEKSLSQKKKQAFFKHLMKRPSNEFLLKFFILTKKRNSLAFLLLRQKSLF